MIVWRTKNTSRRKYGGWSKMASDVASHIRKSTVLWLILALTNDTASETTISGPSSPASSIESSTSTSYAVEEQQDGKKLYETYYIPALLTKNKQIPARGKLVDRYNNQRRLLKKEGVIAKKRKINDTETEGPEKDDIIEHEDLVTWLKYNKEPYQEIREKWLATRPFRIAKDYANKENKLQDILKKYPVLKQNIGYKLTRARAGELWPMERPDGMPVIQSLEVMCGKDHMDVHLTFSHPFEGIVSSKGQHGDPRCVYVPPSTGQTYFSFRIAYAKCGTKPDLHGQFYENTVVVQYDKDLLEVWDEAKRLRCEWFNDYEKTASKPPMVIADLDVVQLDFRGDNVDCWMEIQAGKGPWAAPVSGIVPLGSTLTLVVAINDYRGEFDMRVKSCAASDGSGHVIQLSDEYGCVLRPKMISRFLKAKAVDERATVITYAFFHAFKFPDALSVHIRCKVEICRHGCLDHCQLAGVTPQRHGALDRKDDRTHQDHNEINDSSAEDGGLDISEEARLPLEEAFGDEVSGDVVLAPAPLPQRAPAPVIEPDSDHMSAVEELVEALARPFTDRPTNIDRDRFPHGPRNLGTNISPEPSGDGVVPAKAPGPAVAGPRSLRKRRTVREGRSADVGVSGIYEVVSEADLAFGPSRTEPVTVFSGRIREEVVYGICMGAVSFGALFASAAGAAAGAALAAAVMLQKLRSRMSVQPPIPVSPAPASHSLAAWMALRLLGSQPHPHHSRDG